MTITLYNNKSADNTIGKSKSQIAELSNCQIKEDCSIINPVIVIDISNVTNWIKCNYVYISTFNRYYFVKNVVALAGKLVQFELHVDVLDSFKDEIYDNQGIVSRSESSGVYSKMLDDGVFKTYQNPLVTTNLFPSGFDSHADSYMLAVAGK